MDKLKQVQNLLYQRFKEFKKYSIGKPFKETYLKINKIMVN